MRGKNYKFMQIEDTMSSIDKRVNVIGVAIETSIPKRSGGTDWFRSVKIIDELRTKGIYVHFFSESMETLPQVENVGDILMVSNVTIKAYDPGPYALFNKRHSYFGLFDGRESDIEELVPYHMSSQYKPRDCNNGFITMLRNWFRQQDITFLHESLLLRDIKEAKGLSLLCKILYISNVEDSRMMLYVWDGADAPPSPHKAKLEEEMESPLPFVRKLTDNMHAQSTKAILGALGIIGYSTPSVDESDAFWAGENYRIFTF